MQHAVFADIDDGHAIARDRESLNGDGDNRTGIERRTAVSRATQSAIGIDTVRKRTGDPALPDPYRSGWRPPVGAV